MKLFAKSDFKTDRKFFIKALRNTFSMASINYSYFEITPIQGLTQLALPLPVV